MLRGLLRLVVLAVLVIGIAAFFFGYRWGADGTVVTDASDRHDRRTRADRYDAGARSRS
jgi:hypothetical protein